ncbi:VOC family protein [Solicola gregarius]|uniref:Glyoxalase n=1 Tax=Solicola gregarius TaxID=2908642 RepID=A0AA46TDZ4_9ACTN|nr:VOC family protein [Solicola gregarius]UYM03408.1 glyoxalase [Solicola gregarius]
MTIGLKTVLYPVRDLAAAKPVFIALLGVEPSMDASYYVGFDVAGEHVGLDPNGHAKGMTGPQAFWRVPDAAASVDELVAAGGTVRQPAQDVGGGAITAVIDDVDGNPIGIIQG